jgi:hypothetical protein
VSSPEDDIVVLKELPKTTISGVWAILIGFIVVPEVRIPSGHGGL